MSVETIARVLYDHVNSRFLKYVQDGTESLLGTAAKLRNAAGTIVNPATEGKQDDAITKLTSLDGKDFATQTTLDAVRDNVGEAIESPVAYTLLDRLKASYAKLTEIDTVLDAINLTAGIKKIVDALPIGDNWIGRVKVGDGTHVADTIADVDTPALRRLMTESLLAPGSVVNLGSTIPADPANLVISFLVDGGSPASHDMLVDGSSTPVQFTWVPAAGQAVAVQDVLLCFTADDFEFDGVSFGPNPKLTNGCLFQVYTAGVLTDLYTIYQNEDFLRIPGRIPVINNTGPKDLLSASFVFNGLIKLHGDDGDYVRVTIRDDLTSVKLKYFTATIYGAEI